MEVLTLPIRKGLDVLDATFARPFVGQTHSGVTRSDRSREHNRCQRVGCVARRYVCSADLHQASPGIGTPFHGFRGPR